MRGHVPSYSPLLEAFSSSIKQAKPAPTTPLYIRGPKLLELPLTVFGPFGPKEKPDERGLASVDICLQRRCLAKGGFKGDEPA